MTGEERTKSSAPDFMEEMARVPRDEVQIAGRTLRPGSRVRLRPKSGGDTIDRFLDGRVGMIEGIDEDDEGSTHVAVMIEDDPGRDLGGARHPAHRFFFATSELEPLEEPQREDRQLRVLVAGIGNVFWGDDGFGVAVARLLGKQSLPDGIDVIDFGIRGMDLAYALGQGYAAAILLDAMPRGYVPGTLTVMVPEFDDAEPVFPDGHRMVPHAVLRLARRLGRLPEHVLILGCEPGEMGDEWRLESAMTLSPAVAAAVESAAATAAELAAAFAEGRRIEELLQSP